MTSFSFLFLVDVHRLVQFAPGEGWNEDRDDRRGLPERPQADAAPRGHLRRAASAARQGEDAFPPHRQREQGAAVHRKQGRQARLHRRGG